MPVRLALACARPEVVAINGLNTAVQRRFRLSVKSPDLSDPRFVRERSGIQLGAMRAPLQEMLWTSSRERLGSSRGRCDIDVRSEGIVQ
jgi:hypothetical protein